jgi:hypothetical protein
MIARESEVKRKDKTASMNAVVPLLGPLHTKTPLQ